MEHAMQAEPGTIERSSEIKQLVGALLMVQGAMKPAPKDSENPHFRSKYADLATIWATCRGLLNENGLVVMQLPVEAGEGRVGLVTTLVHTSGEFISSRVSTRLAKDDAQNVGSAITYLRRYSLSAVVGVVADEDDDGNAASGRNGNGGGDSSCARGDNGNRAGEDRAKEPQGGTAQGQVVGVFKLEGDQGFCIELKGGLKLITEVRDVALAASQAQKAGALVKVAHKGQRFGKPVVAKLDVIDKAA